MRSGLTSYWIVPPSHQGPLGFGVTAHNLDDALGIIRSFGYADDLPLDLGSLKITQHVRYADLEETAEL